MGKASVESRHTKAARSCLKGRTIKNVRYASAEETEAMSCGLWSERPLVIELDDGGIIIPQMDSEGNGPGALAYLFMPNGVIEEDTILPAI